MRKNFLQEKLRSLRRAKKYTQKDMAHIAGVQEGSYKRYEYGERVPDARTAALIAKALGTTVEDLWGGSPNK